MGLWAAERQHRHGVLPARQPRRRAFQRTRAWSLVRLSRTVDGSHRGRAPHAARSGRTRCRRSAPSVPAVFGSSCSAITSISADESEELADVYAPDSYAASQRLGERVRARGGAGILYDSIRHTGGVNAAAHRPRNMRGRHPDRSLRGPRVRGEPTHRTAKAVLMPHPQPMLPPPASSDPDDWSDSRGGGPATAVRGAAATAHPVEWQAVAATRPGTSAGSAAGDRHRSRSDQPCRGTDAVPVVQHPHASIYRNLT